MRDLVEDSLLLGGCIRVASRWLLQAVVRLAPHSCSPRLADVAATFSLHRMPGLNPPCDPRIPSRYAHPRVTMQIDVCEILAYINMLAQ